MKINDLDSVLQLAKDIALGMNDKITKAFPGVEGEAVTIAAAPGEGLVELRLCRGRMPIPFARIKILVYGDDHILDCEISAEREIIDIPDTMTSGDLLSEELMQRYVGLYPAVKESITHSYGVVVGNKIDHDRRQATRALEITFMVLDREYRNQKDLMHDLGEIVEMTVPYVSALYEIDRKLANF